MAKTILIVEDEPTMQKVLEKKLKEQGFSVLLAKNGKEGLAVALVSHPDLILLDIVMPIMDGMTMLRELRKDGWGEDARVILLTNLSDDKKAAEAKELKTSNYLIKTNWSLIDVIKKIKQKLD